MKFIQLAIPDVLVIEPRVIGDARGFFMETYRNSLFVENGIKSNFGEDNNSTSLQGILRGLH